MSKSLAFWYIYIRNSLFSLCKSVGQDTICWPDIVNFCSFCVTAKITREMDWQCTFTDCYWATCCWKGKERIGTDHYKITRIVCWPLEDSVMIRVLLKSNERTSHLAQLRLKNSVYTKVLVKCLVMNVDMKISECYHTCDSYGASQPYIHSFPIKSLQAIKPLTGLVSVFLLYITSYWSISQDSFLLC